VVVVEVADGFVVVVVVLPHPLSTIQSESTIAPMINRTLFDDFLTDLYSCLLFYAYAFKRYHREDTTAF
jgi:hypothetical protein